MKPFALLLASGIMALVVLGCGGGGPQVEERPETRSVPTSVPTIAMTPGTTADVPATTVPAGQQLSIAVAPVRDGIPKYDRGEWSHWADEDGDCQNARQEALIAESETPVTYTDDDRCRVSAGSWAGPYTGEVFTDPGDLDIDHMVPLANAHRSGGWAWSEDRKREYANDLTYEGHLIAAKASANRSKGSKGPEDWKPPDHGYWCRYATDWISIKNTWELTATESEAAALGQMLEGCEPSRSLAVVRVEPSQPSATPTPAPASTRVYASCDEAEEADEPRVRGSKGNGRGFAAAKVPSARDGDGDGVVCER